MTAFVNPLPVGIPRCRIARLPAPDECTERPRPARRRRRPRMSAMRFRPCIDLHAGRVKQIVGGTLSDGVTPETNFETALPPSHFADLYRRDALPGGHVIMLGPGNESAALDALQAFPSGMHIGGGINPSNSARYLDAGASHVIVTSYVFRDGLVDWDRVREMADAVGRKRLVLDVSCRKRGEDYLVCTDRWQKWTDFALSAENLAKLGEFCDELLVHAVDVEGKKGGVDLELVGLLAEWATVPITYAGGVRSIDDMERAKRASGGRVDVTIGSALNIFGGSLEYEDAVRWQREQEAAIAAGL